MLGDLMLDILLAILVLVAFTALVQWGRAVRSGIARRSSRGAHPLPRAGDRGFADARNDEQRHAALVHRLRLSLLPQDEAQRLLIGPTSPANASLRWVPGQWVAPDVPAEPQGQLAVALRSQTGHPGLVGPQLHVTGGNLVTRPAYGMDPLTGSWGINAFPDRASSRDWPTSQSR